MPDPSAPTSPPPPGKRRRLGRILLRIVAAAVVILALLVAAVQIFLSTDWPRRILLSQAQSATGLRIELGSLSTGWWGRTRLEDLSLSLPLAEGPFLRIPELDVEHTSLLGILLSRSISIDRVVIHHPTLDAVQNAAGQWNLQQVADLFTGGDSSGGGQTSAAPPQPPAILIEDAQVNVTDQQGRHTAITPVNLSGKLASPLAYALVVNCPGHLRLEGMIALNRTLHQQLTLQVHAIDSWVRPWTELPPLSLTAYWDGSSDGGGLSGLLTLAPLKIGTRSVDGVSQIRLHDGELELLPRSLGVDAGLPAMSRMDFRGGTITLGNGRLTAQRLLAATADGLIQLDGQTDLPLRSASLSALWQDLHLPGDITASGGGHATMQTPLPGQPLIKLSLDANGESPQGAWKTSAQIKGSGSSFAAMNWSIRSNAFTLDRNGGHPPLNITDFVAHVRIKDNTVALSDLSLLAPAQLRGSAAYDFSNGQWWLWINSTGWPLAEGDTFGFDLNAWGNRTYATLHQLYAHAGEAELVASGYYGYDWPKPLSLHVYAGHPPADLLQRPQRGVVHGRLRGYVDADGTIAPLAITLQGQLHGRRLSIQDHPLDNIDAILNGTIGQNKTDVHGRMKLAGGQWKLDATYPDSSTLAGWWRQSTRLAVAADGVDLEQLGRMLGTDDLSGTAQGQWTFQLPSLSLDKALMSGSVKAQNVVAGGQRLTSASAVMTLNRGLLRIWNALAQQADADGQIRAAAWMNLNDPQEVQGRFNAHNWIIQSPDQKMHLTLNATGGLDGPLTYHLASATADGQITAQADLNGKGQGSARAVVKLTLQSHPLTASVSADSPTTRRAVEQEVNLTHLDAQVLGGQLHGQMTARIDNLASIAQIWSWHDLVGVIQGQDIDLDELSNDGELGGRVAFKLKVHPTTRPHPLEPQSIDLSVSTDGGHLGQMQLSGCDLHMYLGHQRLVFAPDADRQSVISLAGGSIHPWLRISRHEGAGYFALLDGRFEQLDLNQLLHARPSDIGPMPGRLAGNFNLQGSLNRPRALNGAGELKITDSDLVNFKPLTLLYNLLNAGGQGKAPTGHGRLDLSLQQSHLMITNAHYFNRGIDTIGSITLDDVWNLKHSPISGGVVGTARPLKDLKVPLLSDADQVLSSLQSFLTAVGIKGTLSKPHVYQTSLNTFGGNFLKALLGDVQKAKQ